MCIAGGRDFGGHLRIMPTTYFELMQISEDSKCHLVQQSKWRFTVVQVIDGILAQV